MQSTESKLRRYDSWIDLIRDIGLTILVWGAVALMIYAAFSLKELDEHTHEIVSNIKKTTDVSNALMGRVYASYGRTDKVAESTLRAIEQVNETIARLDLELFGEREARDPDPRPLITGLRVLLTDLDHSVVSTTAESVVLFRKLGLTVDALTNSAIELDRTLEVVQAELTKNSSVSQSALANLDKAIAQFDKQLENVGTSLTNNLKNTEGITHNLDEITKSVDEALRPLRKASGKLKAFLKFVSQFFRVTVPAF